MKLKILLILLFLLPMSSMAQKVAYAGFKDFTLTFYYNDKQVGNLRTSHAANYVFWLGVIQGVGCGGMDRTLLQGIVRIPNSTD